MSTASRALSGSALVKYETRQRVVAAVQTLQSNGADVKPYMAESLRTKALAMLVPNSGIPDRTEVTVEILQAIQHVAEEHGHATMTARFDPGAGGGDITRLFNSTPVIGIIFHRLRDEDIRGVTRTAQAAGAPFVVLNRHCSDRLVSTCTVDHAQAGRIAAEHLLRLGHRRIGIVFGSLRIEPTRVRLQAIGQAFQDAGLRLDPDLVRVEQVEPADIVAAARELVDSQGATAIVVPNDRMAARVIADAKQRHLAVPGQLSVIGFDGTELGEHTSPPLDSILIPWAQMARAAAELILLKVRDPLIQQTQLEWSPRLIKRGSCAKPPKQ